MTNSINFPPVVPGAGGAGPSVKPVWQLNQMLQALVVGQGSERLFTLRIGTAELSARSDLPLSIGTRLTLQVTHLQPEPVLKVIAAENAISQSTGTDPAIAATRQLLPRQTLMPSLFALLKAASLPGRGTNLPMELKEVMQSILERAPANDLTASGIKRALSDSGLFLEAKLLHSLSSGKTIPELDLKRLLLDLLHRLPGRSGAAAAATQDARAVRHSSRQPLSPAAINEPAAGTAKPVPDSGGHRSLSATDTPGRSTTPRPQARDTLPDLSGIEIDALTNKLRQQAEGALARLTLHQVHSAKPGGEEDLHWAMEIPLSHKGEIDVVPLTIERRSRSKKGPGEPSWLVKLALDTPQYGPLFATILWHKEQVSSVLWAERPSTANLVRHHLGHLHDALTDHGLAVTSLECRAGKPPDSKHHGVPQCRTYGKA